MDQVIATITTAIANIEEEMTKLDVNWDKADSTKKNVVQDKVLLSQVGQLTQKLKISWRVLRLAKEPTAK